MIASIIFMVSLIFGTSALWWMEHAFKFGGYLRFNEMTRDHPILLRGEERVTGGFARVNGIVTLRDVFRPQWHG